MAMKKFLTILFLLMLPLVSLPGKERIRERVYISTDKEVYVAGDAVWMSAWCIDAATGELSSFSKTAYVEIHSSTGMVQTGKISLDKGRGAGRLVLPTTLPTGPYRLIAYTHLGASEEGFDPLPGARTLAVFNTFSAERVPGGVEVVDELPQTPAPVSAGALRVTVADAASSSKARIILSNQGAETVSFSLSVHHDDGIPAQDGDHITDFVRELHALPSARGFDTSVVPDYEGEIIRARVAGTDAEGVKAVVDKYAVISSPGSGENLYTDLITEDGTVSFFTSNIYGEQEMFLEIENLDRGNVCHLELVSPFLDLPAGSFEPLRIHPDWASALELRGLGMQLEKSFDADTLYTALPARMHRLFDERDRKQYKLDDYTRFQLMEEVFVEFIPEVRVRTLGGQKVIQVWAPNPLGGFVFQNGKALALLDGVPVLDHDKILSYDPNLVKRIDIYTHGYFFGARSFDGVVNFVTYKGTLPSLEFADNVRIVDFQGCSWPLAYTCEGVGSEYPDYRQTLYWHPMLTLAPGESLELDCKTPAYKGHFQVIAEGLSDAVEPVRASASFEVK
jgi:hypothetical protein